MTAPLSRAARALIAAYAQGIFPMADPETGQVDWYRPEVRGILPLDRAHCPRRLARTIRQGDFAVRFDSAFVEVMRACAEAARPGNPGTWISAGLIEWYSELHRAGFAHSVEVWRDGRLVGGLYGVALGGLFAGESMVHRERDMSKVALWALIERLRAHDYRLLDTQMMTDHLRQFGGMEISRRDYEHRLAAALTATPRF